MITVLSNTKIYTIKYEILYINGSDQQTPSQVANTAFMDTMLYVICGTKML